MAGKNVISIFRAATSMLRGRSNLAALAGLTFNGQRDLYEYLGYKRTLEYTDFYARYKRGGIASRIVDAYPQATWRQQPILLDPEAQLHDDRGEFVKSFDEMATRLNLYHYFERADKLAGIGQYSVVMIGVKGSGALNTKLPKISSFDDVIYITPYGQENAEVKEYENNPGNERFGLPTVYEVTLSKNIPKQQVHYSRLIHISEGLLEDEIFGRPRMEPVWNYLDDLDKIIGGSSEAVWRTVDRGIQFDIDKEADLSSEDEDDFEDEIEEYIHNFKRYIKTRGVTATPLGAETASIKDNFDASVALIGGTLGIPTRILLGSERGQLASASDERNFSSRVKERQQSYAEPTMIRAFTNRLKSVGVPIEDYNVSWPDVSTLTDKERSDVAARVAQAIRSVSSQDPENQVMSPDDFRKRFIDD